MFTGVTEDSPAPPYYDYPVNKLKDVHRRKPQDQESAVHPILQLNPSYQPLEDAHRRKPQDQERCVLPALQPNPSYEPLKVCVPSLGVKDAHRKNCMCGIEASIDANPNMRFQPIYERLAVFPKTALEVTNAHIVKKNWAAEEQETSVDTEMQPNPSYEPLKVYEANYL